VKNVNELGDKILSDAKECVNEGEPESHCPYYLGYEQIGL
jgi:hypothetical protein